MILVALSANIEGGMCKETNARATLQLQAEAKDVG